MGDPRTVDPCAADRHRQRVARPGPEPDDLQAETLAGIVFRPSSQSARRARDRRRKRAVRFKLFSQTCVIRRFCRRVHQHNDLHGEEALLRRLEKPLETRPPEDLLRGRDEDVRSSGRGFKHDHNPHTTFSDGGRAWQVRINPAFSSHRLQANNSLSIGASPSPDRNGRSNTCPALPANGRPCRRAEPHQEWTRIPRPDLAALPVDHQ